MAIYSCNIRSIGRTTHAAGTAGAHLRYIGRERAAAEIVAQHMPEEPQAARTWMDWHERDARKNARLCDKIRLALPRELDEPQRAALVRDYMAGLTGDRVPWYAAIHQTGKDAHNPHAHIVVVDRDIETGKRVLALSDSTRDRQKKGLPGPSAVEWVRERWEHHANAALERGGHDARIDRRSLEAQGIDRSPQIHVGPRAQHIDTKVKRLESRPVPAPTPRHPERVIDYPMIDAGRTRRERNAEIVDLNLERGARSEDFETRVWARFEQEQRAQDRPIEARVVAAERRRTMEERRIRRGFAEIEADIRARREAERRLVAQWLRQRNAPDSQALKSRHQGERSEIARRHAGLWGRFLSAVDMTGRTRQRRDDERQELQKRQREEREALAARMRQMRAIQLEAVRTRKTAELADVASARTRKLAVLKERQESERRTDDALLQQRAAEREQASRRVEGQIAEWKQAQRASKAPETPHKAPARSERARHWQEATQPPDSPLEARQKRAARLRAELDKTRRTRENRDRDRRLDRDLD